MWGACSLVTIAVVIRNVYATGERVGKGRSACLQVTIAVVVQNEYTTSYGD